MPTGHKRIENLIDPIRLAGTGGSHGLVQLVTKLRKDRSRSTRYVMIMQNPSDPGFVAEYSAIVSEISRFISITVNSKVRTITAEIPNTQFRRTVGVMSGAINGYKEAYKFLQPDTVFSQLQKKQLAEMFTGAYFTGENDLHNGNWGMDDNGNIVKIDNDQAFFNYTASYKGLAAAENSDERLQWWPNMLYARKDAFNITSEDIQNLPFLINAHPDNWLTYNPTGHRWHPQRLNELSKDPEFIKYKYLNLTKLLLITPGQINHCVTTHCSDQNLTNGLNTYLNSRRHALYNALLLDPGYKVFLAQLNSDHSLMNELQTELINYNNQYYSRDGGSFKEKYRDRIFDVNAVPSVINNIANWMGNFSQQEILQRRLSEMQQIKNTEIQALRFLLTRPEFNSYYARPSNLKILGELERSQALTIEHLNDLKSVANPVSRPILDRIVQRINDVNIQINNIQSDLVRVAQVVPAPAAKVVPAPAAKVVPAPVAKVAPAAAVKAAPQQQVNHQPKVVPQPVIAKPVITRSRALKQNNAPIFGVQRQQAKLKPFVPIDPLVVQPPSPQVMKQVAKPMVKLHTELERSKVPKVISDPVVRVDVQQAKAVTPEVKTQDKEPSVLTQIGNWFAKTLEQFKDLFKTPASSDQPTVQPPQKTKSEDKPLETKAQSKLSNETKVDAKQQFQDQETQNFVKKMQRISKEIERLNKLPADKKPDGQNPKNDPRGNNNGRKWPSKK